MEQGAEAGHEYPMLGETDLLAAYEQLGVVRRVNDQNSTLVRQGRMADHSSSHGHEACQMAAALCLSDGDWMATGTAGTTPLKAPLEAHARIQCTPHRWCAGSVILIRLIGSTMGCVTKSLT